MRLYLSKSEFIETSEAIDLSMSLQASTENVRAWYVDPPRMEIVRANGFVGSIQEGGSVNFRDVFFNPHGHGTHTECLGHITREFFSINQCLKQFFFTAELISIEPEILGEDLVITKESISNELDVTFKLGIPREALIIRTLPNSETKKHKN